MPRRAANEPIRTPPQTLIDSLALSQGSGLPLHRQLRDMLREIIAGDLEHGQLFWPEFALVESLGVSRNTVRLALADLAREGLLERSPAGTFVTKPEVQPKVLSMIGVFIGRYHTDINNEILHQISQSCREQNLRLKLYYTHDGGDVASDCLDLDGEPDELGIIFMQDASTARALFNHLEPLGYDTVALSMPNQTYPGAYVDTDSTDAVRIGLEYLMGLGHRHIVLMVNEPADEPSVVAKIDTFYRITNSLGLDEAQVALCGTQHGQSSYDAAYQHMPQVFALSPTAIFAVSDPGAWAALKWLSESGISVPESVSVIGFEDVRPSQFTVPPLTTIAHPISDLAREAIAMLVSHQPRQMLITPKLVVRKSAQQVSIINPVKS